MVMWCDVCHLLWCGLPLTIVYVATRVYTSTVLTPLTPPPPPPPPLSQLNMFLASLVARTAAAPATAGTVKTAKPISVTNSEEAEAE